MLQCSLGGPRVVVVGLVGLPLPALTAKMHCICLVQMSRLPSPNTGVTGVWHLLYHILLHVLPQAASLLLTQRARRRQSTGEVKSISSQVRGDGQPTNKTSGNFGSANGRARFTC